MYVVEPGDCRTRSPRRFSGLYTLIYNKYFVDEIYDATVVNPVVDGSRAVLWQGVDEGVIDGTVNGVGTQSQRHRRRFCGCCNPAISAVMRPGWCSARSLLIVGIAAGMTGGHPMNLLDLVIAASAGSASSSRC